MPATQECWLYCGLGVPNLRKRSFVLEQRRGYEADREMGQMDSDATGASE